MGDELKYAIMLMHCGELQIQYIDMDVSFTGSLTEMNGQYVIVLNSRMTSEFNTRKVMHEIKHIQHTKGTKDKQTCEQEAEEFENYLVDYSQLVNFID